MRKPIEHLAAIALGQQVPDRIADHRAGNGQKQHSGKGTLGFGLTGTTVVMSVLLTAQFRLPRYVPGVYLLAVVLISVVGTLITDNVTDNLSVPLLTTTVVFAVALAGTLAAWYARERTLSIHSIVTSTREAFYWLTVLFTFALITAAGDLVAERRNVGY